MVFKNIFKLEFEMFSELGIPNPFYFNHLSEIIFYMKNI